MIFLAAQNTQSIDRAQALDCVLYQTMVMDDKIRFVYG